MSSTSKGPENPASQQSMASKSWFPFISTVLLCIVISTIAILIQITNDQKHDLGDTVLDPDEEVQILLVGKTGVGKGATGNTILGKDVFKSELSSSSVTAQCEKFHAIVNRRKVSVIDSPGLFDAGLSKDHQINRIKSCIPLSAPGPHVFLVVTQLGRFTEEEANAVKIIQAIFGPENPASQQSLASKSWFPSISTVLLCIVISTIAILIQKNISKASNGGQHYTREMPERAERAIEENHQKHDLADIVPDKEVRILLVGKTGVGKSATGNTILGKKLFKSEISSSSVTGQCENFHAIVNGRKISVIDSPGLFDTNLSADDVINRVKRCIPPSAPGPHVFLVVIHVSRFTEEDEKTVKIIQTVFGGEASAYTMVVFTHGDQLKDKSIHACVRTNPKLVSFIKTCGARFHVLNNEEENPDQVIQLLDQVDKIVTANGGQHYTSEMLEKAERAIEEEKQRILKEREEQRLKEIEATKATSKPESHKEKEQKINETYEKNARNDAEKSNYILNIVSNLIAEVVKKVLQYLFGLLKDKF